MFLTVIEYLDFSKVHTIHSVKPYVDSILINLIGNAIKYRAPERPPIIEVRSEQVGEYWLLSVSDNGLGIDLKAYGSKLFNFYQRFHTHVAGKGMGLYLVKTQVTALRGKSK